MNFEFSDEQKLLRDQARGFLAEHCPMSKVREALEGRGAFDADLWRKVADMGWTATVIQRSSAGLGFRIWNWWSSPKNSDARWRRYPSPRRFIWPPKRC